MSIGLNKKGKKLKRILAALALGLIGITAYAQTYVNPSQLAHRWGFIRKAPCGVDTGDNCGSNPPTWHITPDQCGILISTGAARNESYSKSHTGNGVTTQYQWFFLIQDSAHMVVTVNGVVKTLGVDYTVTGIGDTDGGTVTFTTPPPNGQAIIIKLNQDTTADGVATAFTFNFPINNAKDLEVRVDNVLKTLTTDYTVTGAPFTTGGTVTFTVAPAAASVVNIRLSQFSNKGIRYTLPTVAEFTAAGMGTASGAPGSNGTDNREAQCEIHFVMGAPGAENYLRIGFGEDAVNLIDKFTPFQQGAYDIHHGDITFPYLTPGVVTFLWNGNSWLAHAGSPAIAERMQMGQMWSHGNVRLFQVTADPAWWTVGSKIGALALCPQGGQGLVGQSNGGFQLSTMPIHCVFLDNNTSASQTQWIVMRNIVSGNVTAVTQGAAYAAGTAPNGEPYEAGNYVVLKPTAAVNAASGNTIEVHNISMANGTETNGKWIMKLLTSGDPGCVTGPCFELHQRVDEGNGYGTAATVAVGPPSRFRSGDSMTSVNPVAFNYASLNADAVTNGDKITNPVTGVDFGPAQKLYTVVGLARRTTAIGYQDTTTNRHVVSLFNPVEKKCQNVFTTDRTVTSTSFVEVNSEIRCNFITMTGMNRNNNNLGDQGRRVRYAAVIGAGNGTAANGCEFAVAFNGTTPEPEVAGFVNPAGVGGGRQTVSIHGQKAGLSETSTSSHYITLLARAVTGGTCTINAATTQLTAYIWQ